MVTCTRGLDSGSRYYGNLSDASSQWYSRSACGCGHSFCGGGCGRSAYYGGGGTIVIPYGYNAWNTPVYSQQRWQEPVWTAPDYPELGYYNEYANGSYASQSRWSDYYADEPRIEREQPLVYNDTRCSNSALSIPPTTLSTTLPWRSIKNVCGMLLTP